MDMSSTEENPYKRRKVQPLPRLDENTKKVLSRSFMVSGKAEIEIQNFSKLRIPNGTIAIGGLSIYFGDIILKDISYLRVTPDENGRFKVRFNQLLIPCEDEYVDVNKIYIEVERFHVQHGMGYNEHQKLKPLLRRFQVNIDIPEIEEEYYF